MTHPFFDPGPPKTDPPEWTVAGLSADLRKLADIVESHPEHAEIWRSMMNRLTDFSYSRDEFVAWVRDMTGQLTSEKCGPSRGLKKQYFDQYAVATGYIGFIELTLHTQRDLVCERVVKGYETKLVPDPDAPKVEKRVEIVEWLCNPLLVNAQEGE